MPEPLHYVPYIKPHLLPEATPMGRGKNPDEAFFIRTHQAVEVWFAQLIDEFEYARKKLSREGGVPEKDIPLVTHHIRRAASIVHLLTEHFAQLETLTTASFFDFRRALFSGSGFQSYRNREIEWLLGFADDDVRDYVEGRAGIETAYAAGAVMPGDHSLQLASLKQFAQTRDNMVRRLEVRGVGEEPLAVREALTTRLRDIADNKTLRYWVMRWLERTPHPPEGDEDFISAKGGFSKKWREAYLDSVRADLAHFDMIGAGHHIDKATATLSAEQRLDHFLAAPSRGAIVFILQFSIQPLLAWPAALLDALLDLDQAIANWRVRHVAMVSHVLGSSRISTGGQSGSGLPYLQLSTYKRLFPELWDARSFFIGRQESKTVYSAKDLKRFGFIKDKA